MSRLRQNWIVAPLLILALIFVGCSAPTPTSEPDTPANGDGPSEGPSQPSGEEEPADEQEPLPATVPADLVLDPANAAGDTALEINDLLYDGLTLVADDGPESALAASWQASEDGLTYTFHLRPDLTFSDGAPVDADAVIANFNRWFDPASPLRGSGEYAAWKELFLGFKDETDSDGAPLSLFDGIEKVDALTVIVHLNTQDPDLPVKLAEVPFSLVSPAALEATGGDYGEPDTAFGGSGPYMLGEWTAEQLALAPNSAYWGDAPSDELSYPVE